MRSAVQKAEWSLRLAGPGAFGCVREFLRRAPYDEPTLCQSLGLEHIGQLGSVRWEERDSAGWSDAFGWCVRVFWRGLCITRKECESVCGADVLSACEVLGLLEPAANDPAQLHCPVWLYPVEGWWMASDRPNNPASGLAEPAADVVFPALYAGTLRFLKLLPDARGGDALDLCGGSGIGALHLSRSARLAVTADVTERSAFFAEFNAQLNGVHVASLCGDLYEPVAGRQFDLITAHPPFVPATGQHMIYRDGGEAGEEITRRVVEGLPAHLRPGGTAVVLCVARDTDSERLETRARGWLGAAGSEFDIVYGLEKVLSVEEVVDTMRKRGQAMSPEAAKELLGRLRSLHTKQFVYGALFFRRPGAPPSPEPLRMRLTTAGTAPDFERLLAWRQRSQQPGFLDWLSQARPRLAPGLQLTVRHCVSDGSLVPAEFVFSLEAGFQSALRPDAWVVPLVARLEGHRSVCEVFQSAQQSDELPAGFALQDFCQLIERMIARGFLTVDQDG